MSNSNASLVSKKLSEPAAPSKPSEGWLPDDFDQFHVALLEIARHGETWTPESGTRVSALARRMVALLEGEKTA